MQILYLQNLCCVLGDCTRYGFLIDREKSWWCALIKASYQNLKKIQLNCAHPRPLFKGRAGLEKKLYRAFGKL